MLVATGASDPDVEVQLEVAREFAREKNLTLKEVDLNDTRQVSSVIFFICPFSACLSIYPFILPIICPSIH